MLAGAMNDHDLGGGGRGREKIAQRQDQFIVYGVSFLRPVEPEQGDLPIETPIQQFCHD